LHRHAPGQEGRIHPQDGPHRRVTRTTRFGLALNLNMHFHMLVLKGLYVNLCNGALRFGWVESPASAQSASGWLEKRIASARIWNDYATLDTGINSPIKHAEAATPLDLRTRIAAGW
jgi:hypothetical protein